MRTTLRKPVAQELLRNSEIVFKISTRAVIRRRIMPLTTFPATLERKLLKLVG